MMHLRRRVRNARNNHRTRDDVGWIIPDDAARTRSPDSSAAHDLAVNNDVAEVKLNSRQSYLINLMARRDLK